MVDEVRREHCSDCKVEDTWRRSGIVELWFFNDDADSKGTSDEGTSWVATGPTTEATGTKAGGGAEGQTNDYGAQTAVATSAAIFKTMTMDD